MPTALVWFRNDLRLDDNPALRAALESGYTPIPVYLHAPDEAGAWRPGQASNAWRDKSLAALDTDLRKRGSRLRVFVGPSLPTLQTLVAATGAEALFWNRRYEPAHEQRDTLIKRELRGQGLRVESFNGSLLFEPWTLKTKVGTPFKVFTPFWRAASQCRSPPARYRDPDGVATEVGDRGDAAAREADRPDLARLRHGGIEVVSIRGDREEREELAEVGGRIAVMISATASPAAP